MIKILERSQGNVIGVEASGKITAEDIEAAIIPFEEAIEKYGKINWLFVWKDFKGTTLKAMYEDMMWLLRHLKNFDRMAVVGEKKWQELLIKADGMIFGEKYFDISQLEDAWKYVEEGE